MSTAPEDTRPVTAAAKPTAGAANIGPLGGMLVAGNYALIVPAGALLSTTQLTLQQEVSGQWPVSLGPEGTQFIVPVTLVFNAAAEPTASAMNVQWWNPSTNSWVPQVTINSGTVLSSSISHFSRFTIH
jgi:hypothetical protein